MPMFAFTDADRWVPGIGDPTFMGWLTVVAYFAAFLLCLRVRLLCTSENTGPAQRSFWTGMVILLFALGVNKQLDLQTWFTLTLKRMAKSEGWYEYRRYFQAAFIAAIVLGGVSFVGFINWFARRKMPENKPVILGTAFLICFIIIRAASFHHVDQMLGFAPAGMRLNWVLELGGIAAVGYGAWQALKSFRRARNLSFVMVSMGNRAGP
jgi:hypothetical protein